MIAQSKDSGGVISLWNAIFPDNGGNFLCIAGINYETGQIEEHYFSYPDEAPQAAEKALQLSKRGLDAYFSAHLLTARKRDKEHAAPLSALYADGDGATVSIDKPQPTGVVASSPGKDHFYWALESPIPPEEGEWINQTIAQNIGADPSGYDLSQLLRVPNTVNYKPEYDRPTVEIVSLNGHRYAPQELLEAFPPSSPKGHREKRHSTDADDEPPVKLHPENLKWWAGERHKENGSGDVDRSATLLMIGRVLFDAGANRRVIVEALAERDVALGYEKYTGRRDEEDQYHNIVDELEKEGRNEAPRIHSNKKKENESQEKKSKPRRNQADRLIQYALDSGAPLFMDQFNEPHALIKGVPTPLNSRCYKWLRNMMWAEEGQSANAESVKTAAATLAAFAEASEKVKHLYTRSAFVDGTVYYWLGKGRIAKINKTGWEISSSSPVLFRAVPNLKPLPNPQRGGSLDTLLSLVNLKEERDKRLVLAYTVTLPLEDIQRYILQPTGVMGSGKTTLSRVLKRALDPTTPEAIRVDPRDFIQKASHSYLVMLDNQNSLPGWAVDIICRLVTGEGDSKRRLYSDDEDVIYEMKRAVLLNGINPPADRGDAQDRTLPVELERIPDRKRRSELSLWQVFEEKHPELLGAIFDALAATLKARETIELKQPPRLVDWGFYAAAAYTVFGSSVAQFQEDWAEVVKAQNRETLEGSPVAQAVIEIMKTHTTYSNPASKLLEDLEIAAETLKINIKRDKSWPSSASWVWRRLKEVIPVLSALGITAERSRDKNSRDIILRVEGGDDSNPPKGDSKVTADDSISKNAVTENPAKVSQEPTQGGIGDSNDSISGGFSTPKTSQGEKAKQGVDKPSETPREVPRNAVTAVMLSPEAEVMLDMCRETVEEFGAVMMGIVAQKWRPRGMDYDNFEPTQKALLELGYLKKHPSYPYYKLSESA